MEECMSAVTVLIKYKSLSGQHTLPTLSRLLSLCRKERKLVEANSMPSKGQETEDVRKEVGSKQPWGETTEQR